MHDRDEDISELLTMWNLFIELGRFFLVSFSVIGVGVVLGFICGAI
jgi:hypothetical protein